MPRQRRQKQELYSLGREVWFRKLLQEKERAGTLAVRHLQPAGLDGHRVVLRIAVAANVLQPAPVCF